ncbi:hypothetical protein R0I52_03570 [Psychrobacter sp. CAM01]|uniref:hypothetical protein n=1 Tax=Psychrobacter sp. CAM01 TaxID=3080335 RepID=UPI002935C8C4|nr:hypothetical protein [Psychrobacter sp. CAM01]MDV2859786.1 hypothetical protein [Psychrobacter sp. CAM01]
MAINNHGFTRKIVSILDKYSQDNGKVLLRNSEILQYINTKTKAANRGSKSRGSFANLYAIYVLVEDYLNNGFDNLKLLNLSSNRNISNLIFKTTSINYHLPYLFIFDSSKLYSEYEGAIYSNLLQRQRSLPFGSKLQNHALNHRLNQEFAKYFPNSNYIPVLRDATTSRYWFNENLLIVKNHNLAIPILKIIDEYVKVRQSSFTEFMAYCKEIIDIQEESPQKAVEFIKGLFEPNVDARIFEIASFAVLKHYYSDQSIYWGWEPEKLLKEPLTLYKTGRTNANDGGIDFVMRPLGRFFQVTETVDAGKYFLDIDKVQRYPVTFVVKTNESNNDIKDKIKAQAESQYPVKAIVDKYISSVEEVINIPKLMQIFESILKEGNAKNVIDEIVLQSRVEFNVEAEENDIIVDEDL